MKKIFSILIYLFFFNIPIAKADLCPDGYPCLTGNPPFIFVSEADPTSNEHNVTDLIFPDGSAIYWKNISDNTSTNNLFLLKNWNTAGTPLIWSKIVDSDNISSFIPTPIISKVYISGVLKNNIKMIAVNATVTEGAGQAVFYLTDNGASDGNAVCTNIYENTISFEINNANIGYRQEWSISSDKKTLTATINSSSNIIPDSLGISVLSGYAPAGNGTVARLNLFCD